MNDVSRREAVRETAKKKVGNKKTVKSKTATHYKENLEESIGGSQIPIWNFCIPPYPKYLPTALKAVNEVSETHKDSRFDVLLRQNCFKPYRRPLMIWELSLMPKQMLWGEKKWTK